MKIYKYYVAEIQFAPHNFQIENWGYYWIGIYIINSCVL